MEGGGYGSCSTGEEEADEQCSGGPVDHKQTTHGGEMKHTQAQATSQKRTHTHTHMQGLTVTLPKQTATHLPLSLPPQPGWEEQYKQLK